MPEAPDPSLLVPDLPTRENALPRSAVARWLFSGGSLSGEAHDGRTYPWYQVIWLTGVDYFSSLAYQAGIALIAAGALAPPATVILVMVTLFGALPVYSEVARRSFAGQGSIAMLENLFSGWRSKIFVLVLLGFAATDFIITITLSAADAAVHAIANPYLGPFLHTKQLNLTLFLLVLLAAIFLAGFQEAIQVATFLAVPFLALNAVVLAAGVVRIALHPSMVSAWRASLTLHTDWTGVILASAIIFPKLALGLSGFETGVAVMPLVDGPGDSSQADALPVARIRNTRKLLLAAAAIMAAFLLASSFVTTILIPESAYRAGGPASGRAIAFLAHSLLGNAFGGLYDVSTIAILWFAGASAMAGLINLLPRYLPRFGMAPRWVSFRRPMVLVLFAASLAVTLIFHASVEAQGSAYATGVLVLILSAAVAVTIGLWREFFSSPVQHRGVLPRIVYFFAVSLLFVYTLITNVIERPDGVVISSVFIFVILTLSAISRYQRSRELRVASLTFANPESAQLWSEIAGKRVNLVPLHGSDFQARREKSAALQHHYRLSGPLAFLHVDLLDNRSEFVAPLRLTISREGEDYFLRASGAVAVANTIAYLSELIDPISIVLSLTRGNLMLQSLRYLLWGEGEIGLMVYTILVRYWEWTGSRPGRPILYLMST